MPSWDTELETQPAPGAAGEAMERRFEGRIETRFEVVWVAGRLEGEGRLRNLARSSAWVDDVSVQPPPGARIRITILDPAEEGEDLELFHADVVRRTSSGFAVEFHPASSHKIGRLLDRLVESDRLG